MCCIPIHFNTMNHIFLSLSINNENIDRRYIIQLAKMFTHIYFSALQFIYTCIRAAVLFIFALKIVPLIFKGYVGLMSFLP